MLATATSWKRIPFSSGVPISFQVTLSPQEFERLKQGFIPRDMEDKWFIYYEEPYLFMHRSWTGLPIFRLVLRIKEDCVEVAETLCSKDYAEQSNLSLEYQAALVDFLVSNLLLGKAKPFPVPPGVKEPQPGMFQHHVSGTGYSESPAKPKEP